MTTDVTGETTGDAAVIKITGGAVVTGYTEGNPVDTETCEGAVTETADVTTGDVVTTTEDDTGCAEVTITDAE